MEDKITPQHFLSDREVHLQRQLEELEAELVSLGDVPDDIESLEHQALDALRSLLDLLEPSPPTPSPRPMPALLPVAGSRPGKADSHRRFWRVAAITTALFAAGLLALFLVWTGNSAPTTTTTVAQATSTPTHIPPTLAVTSPRPSATATPIPSPPVVVPETPVRTKKMIQAETARLLDISGTLRLELPLTPMADTIRLVDGLPVLQPILTASGAGVHRGSTPFGSPGSVIIAIPSAPMALRQVQPGDRLIGCNSDRSCHNYQVSASAVWPLERLHQRLQSIAPYAVAEAGVWLYAALDETTAWVVQAQPHGEGVR